MVIGKTFVIRKFNLMKKLLLLLTLLSSIALAAESYICESEAIGGVKFNSQQKKFEGFHSMGHKS